MTEESEAEGDVIRQHPLKWHSQGGAPACAKVLYFTAVRELNKRIKKVSRTMAKVPN